MSRPHYLEEDEGRFGPRDHNCQTHVNQYVFGPLIVLEGIRDFVRFAFPDTKDADGMSQLLEAVADEIHKINFKVVGTDFEKIKEI